ncbi:sigma-70 family RNA polymerase sigma factor [Kistimonas asteriae]|uniref:sigma-70 family RNA polymerase sigma factor n=1 Tax=Kistimonas asteriae TaxID=517724 RepID=UPI001BA6113A|nr:sigma-70 family RNA polymerase sigma factor [Kistimonas asteriae]
MKAWSDNEKALQGWLLKQTGDIEQTQDLLQEVFLKSLKNKERFCTLAHARSWFFTITRNTLIDAVRKPHPETTPFFDQIQQVSETPLLLELQSCMMRVLSELDDNDREVIECCDIQKMSQDAYARSVGLSLPAVKSRLQRARQKLRTQMVNKCRIQFDDTGVCDFTPRHRIG